MNPEAKHLAAKLEDHLDEVKTWLFILENGEDPKTGRLIAGPKLIAEVRNLSRLLEDALKSADLGKMQQAQTAYEACDFFAGPKTGLDVDRLPLAGLFQPGRFMVTPGASALGIDLNPYVARHLSADWGDVLPETAEENEAGLQDDGQLFSLYDTPAGRLLIVTEGDRSTTTIFTPEED